MNFGKWDNAAHSGGEQQKRIATAKKAATTPAVVDRENKAAEFKGSGKVPYITTLDSCNCGDFTKRRLPCKHIYRLALELGLLNGEGAETGINKNDYIDHIFTLTPPAQELLYSLISQHKDEERTTVICERNENHNSLLHAGLIIETVINKDYTSGLDIHSLKRLLVPFEICAEPLGKKVSKKREYLCRWLIDNEAAIIPMIQNHFIALEFTEQLDELKKHIYSRFRKKFIREIVPTEYWGGEVDENNHPIMELNHEETRVILKEFFSQESVGTFA